MRRDRAKPVWAILFYLFILYGFFLKKVQAQAQWLVVRACPVNLRQDREIRKNGEISVFAAVGDCSPLLAEREKFLFVVEMAKDQVVARRSTPAWATGRGRLNRLRSPGRIPVGVGRLTLTCLSMIKFMLFQ